MGFIRNVARLVAQSWQSVTRHFWLSVATVFVGVMALLSVSILWAVVALSDHTLQTLQSKVSITLYFKPDVAEERVRGLGQELARQPEVAQVRFISPDVALERFRDRRRSDPAILEALEAVGGNPFGSSLIVQASSEDGYSSIIAVVREEPYRSLLQQDDEEFAGYEAVISQFTNLANQVRTVGLVTSGVFILIAVMLVFNAVRVAIYTQREEIGIMKLVGAANWYVRLPFVVAGVIYAVASTALLVAALYPLLLVVQPLIDRLWGGDALSLVGYFRSHVWQAIGSLLGGLVVLNVLSAAVAVRRHLKV